MKLPKIICPHCGKVVCVGDVEGHLKCKACGKVFKVQQKNTDWVQPA